MAGSVKLDGAGQLHGRLSVPSSGSWLLAELTAGRNTSAVAMTALLGAGPKIGGPGVLPPPSSPPSGYRVALYNAIIQISSQSKSVAAMRPSHVLPRVGLLYRFLISLRPLWRSASLSAVRPPSPLLRIIPFSTESRCKVTRSELYYYGALCNSRSLPLFIPRINVHGGYILGVPYIPFFNFNAGFSDEFANRRYFLWLTSEGIVIFINLKLKFYWCNVYLN